jgi:hypothetical protein
MGGETSSALARRGGGLSLMAEAYVLERTDGTGRASSRNAVSRLSLSTIY